MRDVVWNERLKLGAAALSSVATAAVGIGFLAPDAALVYGTGASAESRTAAALWLFGALFLHGLAQLVLGTLRG